ncbi:putative pectin lyase E [Leucoagaricus sp. SymC.cos]|nr:putative pectin lyase E [Leucoagaricus sp. SymC.cos]
MTNSIGRGPHIGYDGGYQYVHLVNNYYENVQGHAIDAAAGTQVLVEGNYFNKVTTIDTGNADGSEYFVATVDQAGTPCSSTIGRYCEWNKSAGSGAIPNRASTSVMTALKAYSAVKGYTPKSVNDVQAYVIANAGVGKVN